MLITFRSVIRSKLRISNYVIFFVQLMVITRSGLTGQCVIKLVGPVL